MQEKLTYLVNIQSFDFWLKFRVLFALYDGMSNTIFSSQKQKQKFSQIWLYKSSCCKVIKGPYLAVPKIPNPVPNPAGFSLEIPNPAGFQNPEKFTRLNFLKTQAQNLSKTQETGNFTNPMLPKKQRKNPVIKRQTFASRLSKLESSG